MINTKEKSLQTLIKECDTVFSEYIRLMYADDNGIVTCSCGCGQRKPWRQMQASHYINRDNMATRFLEFNVVPATRECNYYDQQHKHKIAQFINMTYTLRVSISEEYRVTDWLDARGRVTEKFTRPQLIEIRDTYKAKFKELKKQKGL